jgi:hypothetical protein
MRTTAMTMRAGSVFVGLLHCAPGHHRAFTDWHDTDHRPENVGQMRHVYHSERWVAPVDLVASREIRAGGPVDDHGQYLHTYWSSATPAQLQLDMAAVREQLEVLGRCEPINRDFVAVWRDRTHPIHAAVAAAPPGLSLDALPVAPKGGLVATMFGAPAKPDAALARYYTDVVPAITGIDGVLGLYSLLTTVDAAGSSASTRVVVQLCFVKDDPGGVPARLGEVEQALGEHPGERWYRGAYVPSTATDPTPYD